LLLLPQAYPPGNFPGQITPWTGQFGPGPTNPQPKVGWESAIASVVAVQTGQLHQELKEMKSLVGGRRGSNSSSLSRLFKQAWSDRLGVSEDTCENCTYWRREQSKARRDAESIYASLRDREREVDLQEREIELLKCKLEEACALADLAAKPTMMGASQVRGRGYSSGPHEVRPQVGTSCQGRVSIRAKGVPVT